MAGKTVDTEALGKAAQALNNYISAMKLNIQKMKDAATDCSDNMGSDVYSQKAISKLDDCAKDLNSAMETAESLKNAILAKKREIEASHNVF